LLSKSNDCLLLQVETLKKERQQLMDSLKLSMDRLDRSGLSSDNLLRSTWHNSHPLASHHLFGLGKWDYCVNWCLLFFDELEDPERLDGNASTGNTKKLSLFRQCLIAKMRIHRGFPTQTLANIWNVSQATISHYLHVWIPKWGRVGQEISILDVTPGFLKASLPSSFEKAGLGMATVEVDGKDFLKETDRSHAVLTKAGHSHKSSHDAFRALAWSTPRGLIFEHTPLAFGKVEETALNAIWKPRLAKVPPGHEILADRGFDTCARHYPHYNQHRCPTFLRGRDKFTSTEVKSDYQICKLRYTCEVVFSRVTNEKSLKDVIPQHFFKHIQHHWDWACGNANLCKPLMPLGKATHTEI
jgi:hypothetical protein